MNEGPAPTVPITYVQYLINRIQGRVGFGYAGPVADWPTLMDRLFPVLRPYHALEERLEARIREIEAEAEI